MIQTEGEYFTIGEYIAMKAKGETQHRVSKMHMSNRSMTIVFKAFCADKAQAVTYMEASINTDNLSKHVHEPYCGCPAGTEDANGDI